MQLKKTKLHTIITRDSSNFYYCSVLVLTYYLRLVYKTSTKQAIAKVECRSVSKQALLFLLKAMKDYEKKQD